MKQDAESNLGTSPKLTIFLNLNCSTKAFELKQDKKKIKKSCERVKFFAPCYLIGNKQDRPLNSVKIIEM